MAVAAFFPGGLRGVLAEYLIPSGYRATTSPWPSLQFELGSSERPAQALRLCAGAVSTPAIPANPANFDNKVAEKHARVPLAIAQVGR